MKVFFWNNLGTQFEEAFDQPVQHPTIIIISSCRINRNQITGEIGITNMPATSFFLNADNNKVSELRERYVIPEKTLHID